MSVFRNTQIGVTMRISSIWQEIGLTEKCEIINEQDFSVLMLSESKCTESACIFIDNEKFADNIPFNVTMVITKLGLEDKFIQDGRGVCITENPRLTFFMMHNALSATKEYQRKRFETEIDKSASVSEKADICSYNVKIGKNVVIEPFVTIYANVEIGDDTIIRAGATIGGCGFEFKHANQGILSVQHVGGVVIGKNVEIQNNTCIDRAIYPWDNTIIGSNTKIDNLVHVAHGVKVDKNVMIVANSGIGGRVEIHENAWIGFGATIRNGLEVGKNARANMGAVVTKNIEDNQAVTGNFAVKHEKFIEILKNRGGIS